MGVPLQKLFFYSLNCYEVLDYGLRVLVTLAITLAACLVMSLASAMSNLIFMQDLASDIFKESKDKKHHFAQRMCFMEVVSGQLPSFLFFKASDTAKFIREGLSEKMYYVGSLPAKSIILSLQKGGKGLAFNNFLAPV